MIKSFLDEIKNRMKESKEKQYKMFKTSRNNLKLLISKDYNTIDEKDKQYNKQLTSTFHKFSFLYKNSFKNKRKYYNYSMTKNMDSKIRRRIMFTDSYYPVSLKDEELGKSLETQIFFKKVHQSINIIEELDNEDIMMKFLPNNSFDIFHEDYKFEDKEKYKNIIDYYLHEIENYKISFLEHQNTFYKLKKYGNEKIELYLKSLNIKISKEKELIYEWTLPLNIIPFFYSINHREFVFFITNLMIISNDSIIFDKNLIEKIMKEMSNQNMFFNKDSTFFESVKNIKFPLIFNDEEYEFEILLPHIELIKENSFKIIKNVGKGLMYYLLSNNFYNWGNICLCYLSSFKFFRNIVKSLYKNENEDDEIKIYNIDNLYEPNFMVNKFLNNEGRQTRLFFICELANNTTKKFAFFRLYFYKIEIVVNGKDYKYDLSFNDMKKLFNLQKNYKVDDIINKCIITNLQKEKIFFSLDLLNGYNINENFFHPEKNIKTSIYIKNARIHWNEFSKSNTLKAKQISTETYNLDYDLIESLIDNPLNCFPLNFSINFNSVLQKISQRKKIHLRTMKSLKGVKFPQGETSNILRKNIKSFTRKQTSINKGKKMEILEDED